MDEPEVEVYVSVRYQTESTVGENIAEAGDYIISMEAEILGNVDSGPTDPCYEIPLGTLKLYLIRVGNAVNDGTRIFDVFDTYQETHDASCAIYGPSYREFLPVVRKRYDSVCSSNDILLLQYMTIERYARGQRLGLAVLERAIRDWSSGCALVVMKPFPLQFEAADDEKERNQRLELNGFPATERAAFLKLRTYYKQLGFERIGRSDYFAVCPDEILPTAKSLELPSCVSLPSSVVEEKRRLRVR
jgi:hypothetical protein